MEIDRPISHFFHALYNLESFQRHRLNEVKRICIDVKPNPIIKYV